MHYIRTKENNYGINVVIDITTDENFVSTSGLSWIQVESGDPQIGDYFYNDMFINLQSDNYSIIEDLIFNQEEPLRLQREEEEARKLEELQAQADDNFPNAPEPIETTPEVIDPHSLPRPVALVSLYENIELTQEMYDHWSAVNANLKTLINGLENGNPTIDDNAKTATLSPPIEFPDGASQSEFRYHIDENFSDYLQYLKDTDGYQSDLLLRIRTHLGISTT